MNILFASSELSPYAKTGGLGDVIASLPPAIKARGHSVSCVLPLYRSAAEKITRRSLADLQITVPVGPHQYTAHVWETTTDQGIKLFLVQKDEFFDRSHLYGNAFGDYTDAAARFIFFSKVVVELAKYIDPIPQILHLHDWQLGLVPALVRSGALPFKTVLTIHNLAYQGSFWEADFALTNLDQAYFSPQGLEFYGRLNFLKAGIALANQITTVSPRYAQEIQSGEFGCGLDAVLRENNEKLTGIVNGIDYDLWNPGTDKTIPKKFNSRDLKGKEECKQGLLKKFGLKKTEAPVFGCISRLAAQKGFDLMAEVMEQFLAGDVRFVFMGSGDSYYQDYLLHLARKFPEKVGIKIGFDDALAHTVFAGSDFFLIPSRFEPCGLNQLYAQRYATLPVAHATGGLDATVEDLNDSDGSGTGIKFSSYTPDALLGALQRATSLFESKTKLRKARLQALKQKFSWDASAEQYERVYQKALL